MAILLHQTFLLVVHWVTPDDRGRYLVVEGLLNGWQLNLASVYVPSALVMSTLTDLTETLAALP